MKGVNTSGLATRAMRNLRRSYRLVLSLIPTETAEPSTAPRLNAGLCNLGLLLRTNAAPRFARRLGAFPSMPVTRLSTQIGLPGAIRA